MELRRYLQLFRRGWLVLVGCILVGGAIGWATVAGGNSYVSTAQIYVGVRSLQQNQNQLYAEPGLNQVVATYAAMIPSPSFARFALTASGINRSPETVAAETTAAVVTNTTLIDVSVKDSDPLVSQKLANALSETFARQAQSGPAGAEPVPGSVPGEYAYVFQFAGPGAALSKGTTRHVALGAVFGLIVAVLALLLVDYLDTTVRGTESIERRLGLPVLAVVPLVRQPMTARGRPGQSPVRSSGSTLV